MKSINSVNRFSLFTGLCVQWKETDAAIRAAFFDNEFYWEKYKPKERKYFKSKGKVYEIKKFPDGFWRDEYFCVYAIAEDKFSADSINRCGLGTFSLPASHPVTRACTVHDYKYSSPVYQLYYTRANADSDLERDSNSLGYPRLGKIFRVITRWFGGKFWENKKTR